MSNDYSLIPEQLKNVRRWLLWRSIPVENKKPKKIPYYTNGKARNGALDNPDDYRQLVSFPEALAALSSAQSGYYAGLGFAFGRDDVGNYWQGIDLDGIRSHPELEELVCSLPGYVEESPSGDGVHAIGYGEAFAALASNRSGIEAYSAGRYFTVTGKALKRSFEIKCLKSFIEEHLVKLHGGGKKESSINDAAPVNYQPVNINDQLINDLHSALNCLNSDDYGLWIKIGHCLKEIGEQGRSLFLEWSRTSEKYDEKHDARRWYGFNPSRAGYRGVFAEAKQAGWVNSSTERAKQRKEQRQKTLAQPPKTEPDIIQEPEAQEWTPDLSNGIDYLIPFPGLAQDIQRWILDSSIYPQPAIAFAATMSLLAVLIGRQVAYENIKGNTMFICLAESGEGKDWPFKAAEIILEKLEMEHLLCNELASGAALFDTLEESPSVLLHIDEFGNYLSSISGRHSNQFAKEIVDIMTKAYTSGHRKLTGKRCKGLSPKIIREPNLCVFGLSTERQIFDTLKTSDLANGSLARYSILFGRGGMLPRRIKPDSYNVPDAIISELKSLINRVRDSTIFSISNQIERSDDYENEKYELARRIKQLSNGLTGNKAAFIPMYNRVAVRCVQWAMLIDQCQDVSVLRFFEALEMKNTEVFMKKFLHLGADNEDERLAKLLQARIKEGGKKGISARDLTRCTQQIKPIVRRQLLIELEETGLIHCKQLKTNDSQRPTTYYFWTK